MRAASRGVLRCPYCGSGLEPVPASGGGRGSLRCPGGHNFDLARQGYVDLAPAGPTAGTGDTPDMVEARERVEEAGILEPVHGGVADRAATELGRRAAGSPEPVVVDAGAGTGSLLGEILMRSPAALAIALELSRPALRRASRAADGSIDAVACDLWSQWPLADATVDLIVNVLSPRNPAEMARVLAPGGALVVATASADHLGELLEPLGMVEVEPRKARRLREAMEPELALEEATEIRSQARVTPEEAGQLAAMGPTAHHVSVEEIRARTLTLPEPATVTIAVEVATFRRPGDPASLGRA